MTITSNNVKILSLVQQEFQGGITQGEVSLEEEVHKFLKDLPPTKFFFLYFLGHNLDYRSLKILAQRITDIVQNNLFFSSDRSSGSSFVCPSVCVCV